MKAQFTIMQIWIPQYPRARIRDTGDVTTSRPEGARWGAVPRIWRVTEGCLIGAVALGGAMMGGRGIYTYFTVLPFSDLLSLSWTEGSQSWWHRCSPCGSASQGIRLRREDGEQIWRSKGKIFGTRWNLGHDTQHFWSNILIFNLG